MPFIRLKLKGPLGFNLNQSDYSKLAASNWHLTNERLNREQAERQVPEAARVCVKVVVVVGDDGAEDDGGGAGGLAGHGSGRGEGRATLSVYRTTATDTHIIHISGTRYAYVQPYTY